nr:hypothetical protein [Candidatus Sigynarchaeota archaeon]
MTKEDIHVIITGSRNAGISSFIAQKSEDFPANDEVGMGIDIQTTSVYINDTEYSLLFYEIAGTFPLDSLKKIFQKKAVGLAVMFDISNPVSLEFAELIFNQIQEKLGSRMPKIKFLLGSHSDLPKGVSQEAIDAIMTILGGNTYYFEFSSKTGQNMVETMNQIAQKILDNAK